MNKVFAILLMFLLGALVFGLYCVQGVLAVAWIIRHPSQWEDDGYNKGVPDWMANNGDRPPLSWIDNAANYVNRNLFNKNV